LFLALKGRYKNKSDQIKHVTPFQGYNIAHFYPGRCPGLVC